MKYLTEKEIKRYSRHLIIPEIGYEGQTNLKNARVLVVGAGGLGAPLLQYITAAGIGTIGIIDFDNVEFSNLHRQILFNEDDIGKNKVDVARYKLLKINPNVQVEIYNEPITAKNAIEVISKYDIVADGTDNFATRYLVNDTCVKLGRVNVYASIYRFEGQVSVFNYKDKEGNYGPNYRDVFPTQPPSSFIPNCSESGVLGVLPGIIGCLQANEVIKLAGKFGEPLSGSLFTIDTTSLQTSILKISKSSKHDIRTENANNIVLNEIKETCNVTTLRIKEITIDELRDRISNKDEIQIIDVREEYEYHMMNIGGTLIPKDQITDRIQEINTVSDVIIHCQSGKRSSEVVEILQNKFKFNNVYNLKGGINKW